MLAFESVKNMFRDIFVLHTSVQFSTLGVARVDTACETWKSISLLQRMRQKTRARDAQLTAIRLLTSPATVTPSITSTTQSTTLNQLYRTTQSEMLYNL